MFENPARFPMQAVQKEELDSIYEGCSVKVVFDRPNEQVLEVGPSVVSHHCPQEMRLSCTTCALGL